MKLIRKQHRLVVLVLLLVTVVAPIVLFSTTFLNSISSSENQSSTGEDVFSFTFGTGDRRLNLLPQEPFINLQEPLGVIYSEKKNSTGNTFRQLSQESVDQGDGQEKEENPLKQVTEAQGLETNQSDVSSQEISTNNDNKSGNEEIQISKDTEVKIEASSLQESSNANKKLEKDHSEQSRKSSTKDGEAESQMKKVEREKEQPAVRLDTRVRQLKDQLIRAKVYLSLAATRSNAHFIRELRLRMKECQRALGDATKDSDLAKNSYERVKAMEQTLAKGKQIQDDCTAMVKKLRAMMHSTEEQLRVHKKQTLFLTHLTAKTLPKGLHCLPLRLTNDYFSLNSSERTLPDQDKLEVPSLYHYALFTDNVLAAAVVVNSTITHAKVPEKHVFHIVTDKLNYAAMRMWFIVNPPGKATIQIQNIEEFTWLNSSYSPVLKQLGSSSMVDYYFKIRRADSDSNMKYRNPKYLSIMNHLRFYMPEIFPNLNKVLFLDDDVVVQKDLTALWSLDLKGKVIGVVETCGETFHRFDRYLNFSNPLIAKNFSPRACGWAFGMNMFDLEEWKRQNITGVYHSWQNLNHDRQLWKLGTLPPGLITFSNRTYPLDRSWHVLGLGYNPNVGQKEIEHAAVIHYNGNLKPWLEIALPKYRSYWSRYVDYDHMYLRECNINP